ncbi:MAG: hypothetical protein H6658_16425 [Ardenticatenaceae bacterium]|nr:hypothetical protein [Ardenticatenaceae bacterium]
MKRLMLLTVLLNLLLSACSVGVSQEFQAPTPLVVVPTSPVATVGPVATGEMAATAVIITPTSFPVPTPYATIDSAALGRFTNLHFATAGNGLAQGEFTGGTEQVFAIWDYTNMSGEDTVRRLWLKDGEEWLVREEAWNMAAYGSSGTMRDISVYDFEGSGLESGSYQLNLSVNGVEQAWAVFQIRAEQNLATSTETQLAWVKNGHILMLDAWDGTQRQLAQVDEGHEIVELLWLPDARHLLFVVQRPSEASGPPWPHHAIWLVDTQTNSSQQLSSYDENLHRIALLPDAKYIRTIAGSDFGDACFMDRQLIFMKLDENYQRLTLINLHDFEGDLQDKPYWFFPEDAGQWLSDRSYEVSVTAYCLSAEMGASEADLALIGRYRLDLEERTAVKISNP